MAEDKGKSGSEDGGVDLRSKLAARLAVAGGMVAVLLGILAFFDYLATAPDDNEPPVFKQPVPVPLKKEVSKPVLPADNPPEPPPAEKPETPKVELPPPAVDSKPETLPDKLKEKSVATEKPAMPQATAVATKPPLGAPSLKPARQVPEATGLPVSPPSKEIPPAEPREAAGKPSARLVESKPAATPVGPAAQPIHPVMPPNPSRLFSGFVLQAGVFTSLQRAEELHAKLTLSGVPSTLETRVQVGPFRTRQEAEQAQAKLKALGVDAILVPPKGGR